MIPALLGAAVIASVLLWLHFRQSQLNGQVCAGLLIPQVLAVLVMAATAFELINLWQNYTLLLFIGLQYALGAIWEVYRLVTYGKAPGSPAYDAWLWLLYAATASGLLLGFIRLG